MAMSIPENDDKNHDNGNEQSDNQDESQNFFLQGCHACLWLARQLGNPAEDRSISSRDANTDAASRYAMRPLQSDIVCFEVIVLSGVNCSWDRFRLAYRR